MPLHDYARNTALETCDGTNLHWNWDRDFGVHSFGTRRNEVQPDRVRDRALFGEREYPQQSKIAY